MPRFRSTLTAMTLGLVLFATAGANAGWRSFSAGVSNSSGSIRGGVAGVRVGRPVVGRAFGGYEIGKNNFRTLRKAVTGQTPRTGYVAGGVVAGHAGVTTPVRTHSGVVVTQPVVARPVPVTGVVTHGPAPLPTYTRSQTTVSSHVIAPSPVVVSQGQFHGQVITPRAQTRTTTVVVGGAAVSTRRSGFRSGGLEIGKNNFRTLRKAVFGR